MRGTDPRHLFLYGDHLGSTVQVRDADGKGALRLGYSPFGQVFLKHSDHNHWSPADGSASALEQLGNLMPYQYTGRYTEATTGLVHLDARWYNPQTQRFVQPDLWNFRNTGLPMAVRHELMRFTGLDTAQLLRDPGQQMGYGYVSASPLGWVDIYGLGFIRGTVIGKSVNTEGNYNQRGRLEPKSNPYHPRTHAPRTATEQAFNVAAGRVLKSLTQGFISGVEMHTGKITTMTAGGLFIKTMFYSGGLAKCQSHDCYDVPEEPIDDSLLIDPVGSCPANE